MAGEPDILLWEEDSVNDWLISIGYGQYQGFIYGLLHSHLNRPFRAQIADLFCAFLDVPRR